MWHCKSSRIQCSYGSFLCVFLFACQLISDIKRSAHFNFVSSPPPPRKKNPESKFTNLYSYIVDLKFMVSFMEEANLVQSKVLFLLQFKSPLLVSSWFTGNLIQEQVYKTVQPRSVLMHAILWMAKRVINISLFCFHNTFDQPLVRR